MVSEPISFRYLIINLKLCVFSDNENAHISSAGPTIDTAKTGVSSSVRGKAAVSSDVGGKAIVPANVGEVMSFKDVKFRPHEGEVRFRLIHFWEARNVLTKLLLGL